MAQARSEHHTSARIIAILRSADGPMDVSQISGRLGLHPTGVRRMLQQMEGQGLVSGKVARTRVGRPPIHWSATAQAVAEADLPHSGWTMARSLAKAIPATPERLSEVEQAGEEIGRELVDQIGSVSESEEDPVGSALAAMGFAPERDDDGNLTRYRLQACPYAEAVRESPQVVCTLHKGVVKGVLERLRPGSRLSAFEPNPVEAAGCLVEITGPDGEPGTPGH